ncbi:MAG: tetratricopeptide repeat protein [Anaerolineae bacterium]|nr:tetratricopeptide repeat protein [Anaerolineae bacterium]
MTNLHALSLSTAQLNTLADEHKVVILHPADYTNHRRVVRDLFNFHEAGAVVQFLPIHAEPARMFQHLHQCLHEQLGTLEPPLPPHRETRVELLATAINHYPRCLLVLDGYDLLHAPTADQLVLTLAEHLQPGRRLLLLGRQHPITLIHALQRHQRLRAQMLPTNAPTLLVNYLARETSRPVLEVRALGPGQLLINGRTLTQWDGVLPKALFFFLIDRAMTTRDEIFSTFWPELQKREATNVFHVTKRKISEILGMDLTTYASGFYRLADEIELYYDVVSFQEAMQSAAVADTAEEAIQYYEQAIYLYRTPYLNALNAEWAVERRKELHALYGEALHNLGHLYQDTGRMDHALGCFLRAKDTLPQREDLARDAMHLFQLLGQASQALALYHQLAAHLQQHLNVAPSPETTALARHIQHLLDNS